MSRLRCSDRYVWMASMVLSVCLALTGCVASRPAPEVTTPTPEVFTPATAVAPAAPVIAGRVLWGAAPVAGARVQMRTGAWADPQASQVVAQTVADAEGKYALEAPPNDDDFGLVALWPDGGANPAPVTPVRLSPDDKRIEAGVALARELVWLEPGSGAEVSTTPTVRWSGLPGVDHYQLWVVDQGTTELVFELNIAENTASEQRVVLPPLTPGRTYTWDVQGRSADDALLAHRTGEFRVAAPAAAGSSQPMPPISNDLAYTPIAIVEAGLAVEVPAGWLRLEPDWTWTPASRCCCSWQAGRAAANWRRRATPWADSRSISSSSTGSSRARASPSTPSTAPPSRRRATSRMPTPSSCNCASVLARTRCTCSANRGAVRWASCSSSATPSCSTPSSAPGKRYYGLLDAPHKQIVWFEHSGHTPWVSESARFVQVMADNVLAQTQQR